MQRNLFFITLCIGNLYSMEKPAAYPDDLKKFTLARAEVIYSDALCDHIKTDNLPGVEKVLNEYKKQFSKTTLANSQKRDGVTPLLHAVALSRTRIVQRLLCEAGIEVDKADRFNCTPLIASAMEGNAAIAQMLLNAGADRTKKNSDGETALSIARLLKHDQLVALISYKKSTQAAK